MSLGSLARRLLDARLLARVARSYRALFVDLDAVADCFPETAQGAQLLDVGSGDGELLNLILGRRPGLRATMVDLAPSTGIALRPELRDRVRLLPATSLAAYRALGEAPPDLILLSDVLHHVPPAARERFLAEIAAIVGERPVRLVVKEVAPGSLRARLGRIADRWVSGDRNVQLIAPDELRALVAQSIPRLRAHDTPLLERDPPNYCVVFTRDSEPSRR